MQKLSIKSFNNTIKWEPSSYKSFTRRHMGITLSGNHT